MTTIGIDFSLNSPGVCIDHGERLEFISFFNTGGDAWDRTGKPLKKYRRHNEIKSLADASAVPYTRNTHPEIEGYSEYSMEQIQKMNDAIVMANLITGELTKRACGNARIAIEGFAYGSKGMSFIDLIMFNSVLRKSISETYGTGSLIVISPKEAKKFAGNGNADKDYMMSAFVANKAGDPELEASEFHSYMSLISDMESNPKPLDDLVDAYWIMKTAKEKYLKG